MPDHAGRRGILGTGNAAGNVAAAIGSAEDSTLKAVASRTGTRSQESRWS